MPMIVNILNIVPPVDSAFVAGTMDLPTSLSLCPDVPATPGTGWDVAIGIISFIMLIAGLALAGKILDVALPVVGCFIRWKECVNLENSLRLRTNRNIVATYFLTLLCLIAARYRLWAPSFADGFAPFPFLALTFGVVVGYLLLRMVLAHGLKPRDSRRKGNYTVAIREFYTYTIGAGLLLSVTTGILSLCGTADELIRTVLIWEIAAVYLVHFIRKGQILGSSMPLFSTFLYLCALELIPTAALVAAALWF